MRFYAWTIRWAGGMQTSKGIYCFLWSVFFLHVKYFRFFGVRGDFCFLNSKTVGFKLEALEKLRQIKSNSGESIEQYVAHQVRVLNLVVCCCECKNNACMYVCMYVCMHVFVIMTEKADQQ